MFGYKESELYKMNSLVATVGFFIVRILVIPFSWYNFYVFRQELFDFTKSYVLFYGTIVMLILSDCQNLDWCYRLYTSTRRAFSKKEVKQE